MATSRRPPLPKKFMHPPGAFEQQIDRASVSNYTSCQPWLPHTTNNSTLGNNDVKCLFNLLQTWDQHVECWPQIINKQFYYLFHLSSRNKLASAAHYLSDNLFAQDIKQMLAYPLWEVELLKQLTALYQGTCGVMQYYPAPDPGCWTGPSPCLEKKERLLSAQTCQTLCSELLTLSVCLMIHMSRVDSADWLQTNIM